MGRASLKLKFQVLAERELTVTLDDTCTRVSRNIELNKEFIGFALKTDILGIINQLLIIINMSMYLFT